MSDPDTPSLFYILRRKEFMSSPRLARRGAGGISKSDGVDLRNHPYTRQLPRYSTQRSGFLRNLVVNRSEPTGHRLGPFGLRLDEVLPFR